MLKRRSTSGANAAANKYDEALITEMLAPVEDAQASLDFWRQRRGEFPLYRRRARVALSAGAPLVVVFVVAVVAFS